MWQCISCKYPFLSARSRLKFHSSWGYPFLYESYLYHVHRRDHRHNFSPYFYLIYLTYPIPGEPLPDLPLWRRITRSPLTSFIPQMVLSLGAGLLFGRHKKDLTFTWFVQTFVFVLFNRVCTSQVRISLQFVGYRANSLSLLSISCGTPSFFHYSYHNSGLLHVGRVYT